jgi:ABC-2 type transport system permease protein
MRTLRQAARSGSVWGLVFGAYVAASSVGFAASYPTAASRAALARSFGGNAGLAALLGPARHIDTVAGFTAWRSMAVLTTVGAVWALLLATRLLRGEEDAGRWELYLCGPTTRGRAAAEALLGLAGGVAALWAVTAVLTIAAGASPKVRFSGPGSLYLATCLVAGAAMFAAVGALLAELAASRRQANTLGAAVIGASFLVRMVADSTPGLAWLRWASPLGWTEHLHPLTGTRAGGFVPIAALILAAGSGAAALAAGRDIGASALPDRDTPAPHTALLGSPTGLAVRLVRPAALAWAGGLAILGLVLGLVAQAAAAAINSSPTIRDAISRLGGHGGGVKAYLGIAFGTVAALLAFAAAGQVNAARAEEASQHLDHLLVRPVGRGQWLTGRVAVATALLVAVSVVCGACSWVGTALQGGGVGFGELVLAGLNLAPPAIFVLGVGILVYGLVPRRAALISYLIVAWSFLVQLVATLVTSNRLLLDTSVLAHVTPAPAAVPDWASAGALVGLGLVASALGVVGFRSRDLAAE